jgi:DNA-binding MarR family transcriptional regulator
MRETAAPSDPENETDAPGVDRAIMGQFLTKSGFLLARVDQICTSLYGELSSGETLAQAEFLLLLDGLGPAPQIRLARAAGVDTSTTAYILANLGTRGWIARCADQTDRRRAVVTLTPDGASRATTIRADYAELQRQLMAPLEPAASARLRTILGRIASSPQGPAPIWTAEAGTPALDDAPSFLARRALQLFQGQFLASLRPFNLTPRQFSLLVILSILPETTQVGFARLFGLDPSTCGVVMRNLARRGLIEGEASSGDRRARDYRITKAGREIFGQAEPLAEQSERLVFRGEPQAEIAWLVAQLQHLVRAHSHRLRYPGALAGTGPA